MPETPDIATAEAPPPAGHNQPPKTPFESAEDRIETLHIEANNWFDGEAIENQGQADAVSKLLDDIRKAKKDAEAARKAEADPFDKGKAGVFARYESMLGKGKSKIGKADMIADLCKKVLAPFLAKLEDEKREVERIAREKAEEAAAKAREALAKAAPTDLAAREEAERYLDDAKAAEKHLRRAEKDKGVARGCTRAVTLRSVWSGSITNLTDCARHYWLNDRAALEALIADLVQRDVREGVRSIPGVEITEERVAQ